ncbi:unnamed protein product [Ectocarpus sp. 12 AP-2014]
MAYFFSSTGTTPQAHEKSHRARAQDLPDDMINVERAEDWAMASEHTTEQ